MRKKITTAENLIWFAKGPTQLGAELGIEARSVMCWKHSGVPLKYWDHIMKSYGVTLEELYKIYITAVRGRAK